MRAKVPSLNASSGWMACCCFLPCSDRWGIAHPTLSHGDAGHIGNSERNDPRKMVSYATGRQAHVASIRSFAPASIGVFSQGEC
jgi:hypothetical protein